MSANDATQILHRMASGDPAAAPELLAMVDQELRRLAGAAMKRESPDHTLQPTALVNEACLRLLGSNTAYNDRRHFLAVAATAMRHILTDHARRRKARRRSGGGVRVALEAVEPVDKGTPDVDIEALGEALEQLERIQPRHHRVVELRFFGGLTAPETAELLGISLSTVEADWRAARAWLMAALKDSPAPDGESA